MVIRNNKNGKGDNEVKIFVQGNGSKLHVIVSTFMGEGQFIAMMVLV